MEQNIIHEHYFIKPGCTLTPEELAIEIAKFDEACKRSTPMDLAELDRHLHKIRYDSKEWANT